jgi:DNA invertase Pin-like site-specific DNA recombinase
MSKIGADHLARRACVYVRQSTPEQVRNNIESKRMQYALADRARQLGWTDVEVIDEDLGVSGSGATRPGFERLLGALCDGKVGAVLSIEVSRLARNGRDWHTLLQFCSVVRALLIDANNIYDPTQINDALLLGIKGTISEMEVATFRQRAQSALQNMAKRGELFRRIAIGYVRGPGNRIDKDPDERIRAALELAFRKFAELGSARQLYFWLSEQQIKMPAVSGAGNEQKVIWKLPRYHTVLQNPVYAGAYAYGRSKTAVHLHQGRKRTVRQKHPQREQWSVLIPDHHEGYISWETFNSNLKMIAHNANGKGDLVRGSVKRGGALLSGILRCGHCGAKLLAQYPGPAVIRYQCSSYTLDRETRCCVSFGGLRVDNMVADQVLEYLEPLGIEASIRAIESLQGEYIRRGSRWSRRATKSVARSASTMPWIP